MVVDRTELKNIVGHTEDDHDQEIDVLIPIVQEDLCDWLDNYFPDPLITYTASELSFVSGDPDTITDNQSEFVKKRFAAGQDIAIAGNHPNEGIYQLDGVAAGTLTLSTSNELVSCAYDDTDYTPGGSTIFRIKWPGMMKIAVSRAVWYLITRQKGGGQLSENKDGVVIQYDRRYKYPREIYRLIENYKRPSFA